MSELEQKEAEAAAQQLADDRATASFFAGYLAGAVMKARDEDVIAVAGVHLDDHGYEASDQPWVLHVQTESGLRLDVTVEKRPR